MGRADSTGSAGEAQIEPRVEAAPHLGIAELEIDSRLPVLVVPDYDAGCINRRVIGQRNRDVQHLCGLQRKRSRYRHSVAAHIDGRTLKASSRSDNRQRDLKIRRASEMPPVPAQHQIVGGIECPPNGERLNWPAQKEVGAALQGLIDVGRIRRRRKDDRVFVRPALADAGQDWRRSRNRVEIEHHRFISGAIELLRNLCRVAAGLCLDAKFAGYAAEGRDQQWIRTQQKCTNRRSIGH
jgi:hypothetical protein